MHAQMHPAWFHGPEYFQLTEAHPKSTAVSMSGVSCHSCSEGTERPRTDLTSDHQGRRRKGNLSLCCVPGHPSSCPIEPWDHSFLGLFSPQDSTSCCPHSPHTAPAWSVCLCSPRARPCSHLPSCICLGELNWRANQLES